MNNKLALSILYNVECNCNHPLDYAVLVPSQGLSPIVLKEIQEFLSTTIQGGNIEHDNFAEDGGLTIACLLYCEVMRLKEEAQKRIGSI